VTHRILIVDDEVTLRYFLRLNLEHHGYQVTEAADGKTALKLIEHNSFHVALIDLQLTDMNGLDIMRYLRKSAPTTSVIILTGYATVNSAIEALRHGAHDYLTKPYKTEELLSSVADGIARQSAALPQRQDNPADVLTVGELSLNPAARQVMRGDQVINLTPTEFDILEVLMSRRNTAVDAIALVKAVRGYEANEADARAIARVHIHRLRHKVEIEPSNPEYILTVAGGRYLIGDEL
jgi:two-component system response regulator MtrA